MNDIEKIVFKNIEPGRPIIIAGPCSAESREQVLTTAAELYKYGIRIFRAGVWKPRTKPGGFEGVGIQALEWLAEVKEQYGMEIATEVANASHVEAAIKAGINLIWIGARTSANPFAMQEIANCLRNYKDISVLVKNPINPDLELWIGSLERLYNAGIRKLGAIHRGFSVYGQHMYRNMPQWHIPIELRRRLPQLQIFTDPSHIGGRRELIAPISQQSMDMGFDGLIIESHCNPEMALSDKAQQVTPEVLNSIINTLVIRDNVQTTENLNTLRQQIDQIDNDLLEILSKRMQISKEIGQYKKEHNLTVFQARRHDDVLRSRVQYGVNMGMDGDFVKAVYQAIHEESVRLQMNIINNNNSI